VCLRGLMKGVLQHLMKYNDLHQFEEDGVLQREDAMIMQHITQLPYLSEWMRMVRKRSHDHLQT